MFVDASAIVAILAREPGFEVLLGRLERAPSPITSAVAIFESTSAISRLGTIPVEQAEDNVRAFLAACEIAIVPVEDGDAGNAITAHARFGRGGGHPAKLNLGDCFAYACAQSHKVGILFAGSDFSKTDLGRPMD